MPSALRQDGRTPDAPGVVSQSALLRPAADMAEVQVLITELLALGAGPHVGIKTVYEAAPHGCRLQAEFK